MSNVRPDRKPEEKTGPRIRGGAPPYNHAGIAELFGESHTATVILYIRENPGCRKSHIARDVVRNGRMPEKLRILEDLGILTADDRGSNRVVYRLTPKGERIAGLLDEIGSALRNDD